jgi:ribA/ribD-fused uncharacterized protein
MIIEKYNNEKNLEFVLFWKTAKGSISSGCFSQWQYSPFVIDNREYLYAEQFMMAEKARLFDDGETLEKILGANNPRAMKSLGRLVKNFNADRWEEAKYRIVLYGNYYKFMQNEELKNYLISTNEKVLVEASPYDKIWGIGLDANDKRAYNPNEWRGENLLGFAIMEIRNMIRNNQDGKDGV